MKKIHHLRMNTINTKAALASFLLIICLNKTMNAQRVGIGTNAPLRKLSVTGSILVDQNSTNTGSLDSAALVFGNAGIAGITSRQNGIDPNGLQFWTNNTLNMALSPQGNLVVGGSWSNVTRLAVNGNALVEGNMNALGSMFAQGNLGTQGKMGIGGGYDPDYRLRVYDGNTRLGGDMHATGFVAFGGDVDTDYRLRVWDGNTRFGGDMHATGNVGIGGLPDPLFQLRVMGLGSARFDGNLSALGNGAVGGAIDPTYRLRVYGGNSRFGGDVEITGDVTIGGKGSVRSNGPSPLRIGFDEKTVNVALAANSGLTVQANITDFAGGNSDVRVMVSQVDLEPGNTMFLDNLIVHIIAVDAAANTCTLRLVNRGNVAATLVASIYLTTIAKN